jgi:hypothetical protein
MTMDDDDFIHSDDVTSAAPAVEHVSESAPSSAGHTVQVVVWGIAIVAFTVWVLVARVHTYLGVKAPIWDKSGKAHIWQVWWRSRDEIIAKGSTAFVAVYMVLILAVIILSAVAVWLALAPDSTDDRPHAHIATQ